MSNLKKFIFILIFFLGFFFIPVDSGYVQNAVKEALLMMQDYARQHVLLCLIPAFFIAGAIGNFVSQGAVLKYLGAKANKVLAYGVASVSGAILAVCSCTVLPLFGSIYKRGAGLGPAIAFLYSGPAINVLAIIMTARILGIEIGIARAIGAIIFSIIIGLLMHLIFLKEESKRNKDLELMIPPDEGTTRRLWQTTLYIFSMVGILIFVNWGKDENLFFWNLIFQYKYIITGIFGILLITTIVLWFKKDELKSWVKSSYDFAIQIMPLLFGGVLVAGFLLGRPGHEGIIPSKYVAMLVGGNSLFANFFASIVGAFMYFATLTEVPILQSLIGSGMGKGPALALLLAGPALSLPSMLAIRSMIGTKKTVVYVSLVVIMATITGMLFGLIRG
ncbi:MAG TPA: permease [Spirochaetota bacterium]|nr:permease [Spirochaetota bacterium]HOL57029.1 permease [Spirochaetota bacterium]HPP04608.1 permease [Spirochaetota bacterium]